VKLKQYLTEKEVFYSAKVFTEAIKNDCTDYLYLIGQGDVFRKGSRALRKLNDPGVKKVRTDRKPKGTNIEAYKFVNKWLDRNKCARRDRSVICTTSPFQTALFGPLFYIFPIGKNLKYAWIKSKDFNEVSSDSFWDIYDFEDAIRREDIGDAERMLNDNIECSYISTAQDKQYETWFECKEYYFISEVLAKNEIYKRAFKKIGVNI
jgi:hypothetical protein